MALFQLALMTPPQHCFGCPVKGRGLQLSKEALAAALAPITSWGWLVSAKIQAADAASSQGRLSPTVRLGLGKQGVLAGPGACSLLGCLLFSE